MADAPVQAPQPALDDSLPISPWQSGTIRAIVKGALADAVSIALKLTGKVYPPAQYLVDYGADEICNLLSLWWYYSAANGRINATKVIKK